MSEYAGGGKRWPLPRAIVAGFILITGIEGPLVVWFAVGVLIWCLVSLPVAAIAVGRFVRLVPSKRKRALAGASPAVVEGFSFSLAECYGPLACGRDARVSIKPPHQSRRTPNADL